MKRKDFWKSRCQVPGARCQVSKSGVRSWNEERLLPAFCFLPSTFRLVPSAFCVLLSAFCFLPSVGCLLHLGSGGAGQGPAPCSLSLGNLFGLVCFESKCRLSGW